MSRQCGAAVRQEEGEKEMARARAPPPRAHSNLHLHSFLRLCLCLPHSGRHWPRFRSVKTSRHTIVQGSAWIHRI